MFKFLFALFALLAVAFAAPAANPGPNPAPQVITTYGSLGYSTYPQVTAYSTYPHHVNVPSIAVPSTYVYGTPGLVYG